MCEHEWQGKLLWQVLQALGFWLVFRIVGLGFLVLIPSIFQNPKAVNPKSLNPNTLGAAGLGAYRVSAVWASEASCPKAPCTRIVYT